MVKIKENEIREKKGEKTDKTKALDLAINQIEKQFGKGSIMKLGQDFHDVKDDLPEEPFPEFLGTCRDT